MILIIFVPHYKVILITENFNFQECAGGSMKKFTGFYKGINLGGWISQCKEYSKEHYDSFISRDDFFKIKELGFDHVRLPLDYNVIMEDDGSFIESGFSYLDKGISWAKESGLKVVLDLHKTLGYMFDTNAVPNPDDFFINSKLQDVFVKIWDKLSERYKDCTDMVAFELLNEIVNPHYEEKWNEIASRAFAVIRKNAPDSWILVGGVNYNSVSAVPGIKVPFDEKTVLNFHCYEPLVFTHQKAHWIKEMPSDFDVNYPGPDINYLREKSSSIPQARYGAIFDPAMDNLQLDENFFINLFKPAIDTAEKLNIPLYCGEYGVIDKAPAPDTAVWFSHIHKAMNKYQISSAIWSYKEMDFGLIGSHYDSVRSQICSGLEAWDGN